MYYLVCPVGAVSGNSDLLTYHSDAALDVGAIAKIPFGTRTKMGVVIQKVQRPSFPTKPIDEVIDGRMPAHLVGLAQWMSEYYATRLPIVLQTMLPAGLTKKRRTKKPDTPKLSRTSSDYPLTKEQSAALKAINTSPQTTSLLHGVTGSGKTRVYQELAKNALAKNQSVILLVPEIALTPQLLAEFQAIHDDVLVLHSRLTESERHQLWQQMVTQPDKPRVIIGPRSALFAPIINLGLLVVDEAHEPSYQQDSNPKYNALRVARKLADLSPCKPRLILGSATPNVADYFLAESTKTPIITLSSPTAKRNVRVEVIDISDSNEFGSSKLFGKKLLAAMNKTIAQNQQVLLFHNRRGSARQNLCSNCGWVAECPTCHIPLRLHRDYGRLLCHTCGLVQDLYKTCPVCNSTDVIFRGFGSKHIEEEVQKLYPHKGIARFDSDTAAPDQLHNRYQEIYDNKISVIVGTQGIAKGLDLPNLATVGVVQADSELFIPDYSSTERSFQLTTQVLGRAGRAGQQATVIIQTLNPEHPAIRYAAAQDYGAFYKHELGERKAEHMPPYTFLLQLTIGYGSAQHARRTAEDMKTKILAAHQEVFVRGPAPAFHEHRGSQYYQQLVVSSHKRGVLVAIAQSLPQRWHFTLDPINLL